MTRKPMTRRGGFTLIELLVVIAIIAILMGMLISGVMKVLGKGPEVKVREDLSSMAASITSFQTSRNVAYLPSRFVLREDGQYSAADIDPTWQATARESGPYLKQLFPGYNTATPTDWNGDGTIQTGTAGTYYLEGSQCLVFFLGGLRGTEGFSTNNRNPAEPRSVRADRIGPFFQFEAKRLNTTQNAAFPTYTDHFAQVYAYFSSYKREDGYNRYGVSDCSSLGVSPYIQRVDANGKATYHNPKTFQIISAGKDGVFGPGGQWPPMQATAGQDDFANFHRARLGAY